MENVSLHGYFDSACRLPHSQPNSSRTDARAPRYTTTLLLFSKFEERSIYGYGENPRIPGHTTHTHTHTHTQSKYNNPHTGLITNVIWPVNPPILAPLPVEKCFWSIPNWVLTAQLRWSLSVRLADIHKKKGWEKLSSQQLLETL